MKNQLLAAIALCCATSSTMPLWAQQYGQPSIEVITPNLATDGTGGGVYYVYHVATGKFLAAGNQSGTQLSIDSIGQEITLTYGEERAGTFGTEPIVPGEGWIFNMVNGPAAEHRFHEVYMTSESQAFVDCGTEGHTLYAITKNTDNDYYRIKVVAQDPIYGAESGSSFYANGSWGVSPNTTTVNTLLDPNLPGFEGSGIDWQFVTPEDYEVYQAKNGPLRTALNFAVEHGYANLSEYEAVFNKKDATVEEINKAASELTQTVNDQLGQGATVEQPKDFTDMIVNPDFTNDGQGWTDDAGGPGLGFGNNGWVYTDPDNPDIGEMNHFCEKWQAAPASTPMHTYQVLSGMPQGRYRLSALTLGYNQAESTGVHRGVYLFADNYRAEAQTLEFGGVSSETGEPNSGTPKPRLVTLEFYTRGGDITIGFMTENTNCNWIGVDNFKLQYLGNEGGLASELNRVVAAAEQSKADLDGANSAYTAACGTKFSDAIAHAKELVATSGVSDDDLMAALELVNARMDSLNAEIEAYNRFDTEVQPAIAAITTESPYQGVSFPQYGMYRGQLTVARNNKTLTIADIDGAYDEALRLYNEDVVNMLREGGISNMTGLIQNADFTDNNDGWTFTKTGNGDFKHANNMSEVWNGRDWEVYQELSDLPQGFYKITAQAFYSPSSPNSAVWHATYGAEGDEVNVVMASIFGNDASALIHHVADFPQDTDMGKNCEQLSGMTNAPELDGKYLPVGLAGAQAIFQADEKNYCDSVTCYVAEDGKLRFGMRLSGVTRDQSWVAFDNFQLTYVGAEDQQGAVSALSAKIAEAQTLPTADCRVDEAKNGLMNAIAEAQILVQKEQITASEFAKAMSALSSSIELFNMANTKLDDLNEVVLSYLAEEDSYYNLYGEKEVTAFMDLVYDADDMLAGDGSYETVADVDQAVLDLNEAYGAMVMSSIDYSGVSKDVPVDMTAMLQTPSFSEAGEAIEGEDDTEGADEVASSKGWTATGGTATTALNYEFFNLQDAEIRQTVYGLPKGYYRLSYNGFYRGGDWKPAAMACRDGKEEVLAAAFVETGENKWSQPLASIFDYVEEFLYTSNDHVLPDTLRVDENLVYNCIVNDVTGADHAFKNGSYEGDFSFYVPVDGQPVTLGVRKDSLIGNDWTIFDNFALEYYGDGDSNKPDDFTSSVEDAVAEGTAEVVATQWYTINGVRVDEPKQRGIYIRQDMLSDGSKKAVKVMVK